MEKSKKKRGAKIAAALVALTALTCCFVGTTFARYTSSTEATGTATIAHWEVTGISQNGTPETEFTFDTDNAKLSPKLPTVTDGVEESTAGLANKVVSETLTITNKSDVVAEISWTWVENALKYTWEGSYINAEGTAITPADDVTEATQDKTYKALANSVLTWEIVAVDASGKALTTQPTDSKTTLAARTGTEGSYTYESYYLQVTLTWTTNETNGDDIDTIVGMYLKSVENKLKLTAKQASQLPAAPATGA